MYSHYLDERIIASIVDAKILLSRGYPKETTFNFVAQKYSLTKSERNYLHRLVHTPEEIKLVKKKLKKPNYITGRHVAVDGFNILITLEAGLRGHNLYICDDGMIRDLESSYGRYKLSEYTHIALNKLTSYIASLKPSKVTFIYDAPISHSGEIASITREILNKYSLKGDATTSKRPDSELTRTGDVVLTSDIVIIKYAKAVVDIVHALYKQYKFNIIDLRPLIQKELKNLLHYISNFIII